jgi:hypothetical protein
VVFRRTRRVVSSNEINAGIALQDPADGGEVMGQQQIVTVQKAHHLPPGGQDSGVAGGRDALRRLAVRDDPRVAELLGHLQGGVAGAIVDHHHLQPGIGLRQDRPDA